MRHGYPVVLDLEGKRCAVIDAGRECVEKTASLLAAGARVTVFTPELPEELRMIAADFATLTHVPRNWRPGDLAGHFLAVVTTKESARNRQIFAEAEASHILINSLDDPEHCRFYFPSLVRRGALLIAISTQGIAPALAVRIRQKLESEYGPEYAAFLEMASARREGISAAFPDFSTRRTLWYRLVDSEILALLRAEQFEEASRAWDGIIATAQANS